MNHARLGVPVAACAFTCLAAMAAGQGSPHPSRAAERQAPAQTVEELVAAALERSASVAALRERLAAAREMVGPSGAIPDPSVELMLQDVGFPSWTVGAQEMSMIGPEVRQELPFPGKRAARRGVADAEASARAAELDQVRREVAMQVRVLYGRVWALDRERQHLDASREMLEMLSVTAASRYAVGESNQEAVLKAQLELSRLAERIDDVAADRAARVAALNRLLDREGAAPVGPALELPKPEAPPLPWEEQAVRSSPEVTVRRASVAAAEKRVTVARLDLKPDFTTGAAVGLRGGFDPTVTLRFGVTYPFWKKEKQEPLVRVAQDELAMARAELRDAEASARSAAARLAAEWQRTNRQIERYREAIVPQSSAAVDAARANYLAGRGDFLTVVDDFNRWLSARIELALREADRFVTWAEIEALIAPPDGQHATKEN